MNYRNVYLRKDRRYEGRVFLDTSGSKRKYHAFFGKTQDEVIAKMKKYHIDLISKTQIKKHSQKCMRNGLVLLQYA